MSRYATPMVTDTARKPYLPENPNETAPPVFFLAKLSTEAMRIIKDELETKTDIDVGCLDGNGEKQFCYVEWTGEAEEGGEADIYRIAKTVKDEGGPLQIIFVDKKAVEEKTVILTDFAFAWTEGPDEDEYKELGYGRLKGREAHLAWINLDIANMSLDEFLDYQDPRIISDPDFVQAVATSLGQVEL